MALLKRPDGAKKQRKRLGRGPGTGNGTTAGKGTKGQNARSGGGVRPGFEGGQMPLYRRIARRGFSNYRFKKVYTTINVSSLEKRFDSGAAVNLETLREKRLIGTNDELVKILGDGELTKKLTVSGVRVSATAKAKIEAAGGSVEDAEPAWEDRPAAIAGPAKPESAKPTDAEAGAKADEPKAEAAPSEEASSSHAAENEESSTNEDE